MTACVCVWEEKEPEVQTCCNTVTSADPQLQHAMLTAVCDTCAQVTVVACDHKRVIVCLCAGGSIGALVHSRSACFPVGYFQWPGQEMSENRRNATQLSRTGKINLEQPPASSSGGCPPSHF